MFTLKSSIRAAAAFLCPVPLSPRENGPRQVSAPLGPRFASLSPDMLGCTCVKLSRVVTDADFGAGGAWFASSLPTFEREETLPRWKSLANATENLAMCVTWGRGSWAVLPKAMCLTSFVTSQLSVASPTGDLGLLPRSVCQAFMVCARSVGVPSDL